MTSELAADFGIPSSAVPPGWQLALTDLVANYMMAKFQEILFRTIDGDGKPNICHIPDSSMSVQLVCDCDRAANMLAEAYGNRGEQPS